MRHDITLVTTVSGVTGRTKARTWSKLLGGAGPAGTLVKGLYRASGGLVNATMKLLTTTSLSIPTAGKTVSQLVVSPVLNSKKILAACISNAMQ